MKKKTLHVERSTSYQGYDGDEFIISKDTLNEVYHRFPSSAPVDRYARISL